MDALCEISIMGEELGRKNYVGNREACGVGAVPGDDELREYDERGRLPEGRGKLVAPNIRTVSSRSSPGPRRRTFMSSRQGTRATRDKFVKPMKKK